MAKKIADFSEWQGKIDFGQVKNEVDMVILRVQAGSSHPDTNYASYIADCKANGIPYGTYAYAKYVSVADAKQEASDCFSRMDKGSKFVVIDVEEVSTKNPAELVPATQAFVDYLHSMGVQKVGLYSGEYFYKQQGLDQVRIDFLWLANYGANNGNQNTPPSIPCDIWQFTSVGNVAGVSTNVDLNTLVGGKLLSYFIGGPDIPPQPQMPPLFCLNNTVYAKVQSVGGNDIRKAPTHNSEFVRNTADNEVFDAYDERNGFYNVGGDNWIDSNGGQNAHIIQVLYPTPIVPHQDPVFCTRDVVYAKVQSVGGNDIRKAPTHNSDFVRNTEDGEQFDAYDFVNGFYNVGGDNWVDANGGSSVHVVQSFFPEPQPTKVVAPAPAPEPKPTPAPVVAPTTPVAQSQPVQQAKVEPTPSANVVIQPSANTEIKKAVSVDTHISANSTTAPPVLSVSAQPSGNTSSLIAKQIEDAVAKDPQLQKSILKKILDFIISLFK